VMPTAALSSWCDSSPRRRSRAAHIETRRRRLRGIPQACSASVCGARAREPGPSDGSGGFQVYLPAGRPLRYFTVGLGWLSFSEVFESSRKGCFGNCRFSVRP